MPQDIASLALEPKIESYEMSEMKMKLHNRFDSLPWVSDSSGMPDARSPLHLPHGHGWCTTHDAATNDRRN